MMSDQEFARQLVRSVTFLTVQYVVEKAIQNHANGKQIVNLEPVGNFIVKTCNFVKQKFAATEERILKIKDPDYDRQEQDCLDTVIEMIQHQDQ